MKSKYALLAGAGVIVFLAGIVSLLCVLYEKKGGSLVYMGAELRNTIEIPLSEADSLLVDYGSKNLDVYVWQEDRIVIKEYLSSGRSDAKATVEYDGNRAVVTGGKWNYLLVPGISAKRKVPPLRQRKPRYGREVEIFAGKAPKPVKWAFLQTAEIFGRPALWETRRFTREAVIL